MTQAERMLVTVTSHQWLYSLVLALALTEALKTFAGKREPEEKESRGRSPDSSLPFDPWCLPALASMVVLLVPFFHGMNLYLRRVYTGPPEPAPYGGWLLLDSAVFMIEACVLFLLSRHMARTQWTTFYSLVAGLLAIDAAWGFFVWDVHGASTLRWAIVNSVAAPSLVTLRVLLPKLDIAGPLLCCLLVVVRSGADYLLSRDFYFG